MHFCPYLKFVCLLLCLLDDLLFATRLYAVCTRIRVYYTHIRVQEQSPEGPIFRSSKTEGSLQLLELVFYPLTFAGYVWCVPALPWKTKRITDHNHRRICCSADFSVTAGRLVKLGVASAAYYTGVGHQMWIQGMVQTVRRGVAQCKFALW